MSFSSSRERIVTAMRYMKTPKEILADIEKLSGVVHNNKPSYNIHQRYILDRRWQAYKIVALGIVTYEEYQDALQYVEQLIDISNSGYAREKDDWLLNELVAVVQEYEKKTYP